MQAAPISPTLSNTLPRRAPQQPQVLSGASKPAAGPEPTADKNNVAPDILAPSSAAPAKSAALPRTASQTSAAGTLLDLTSPAAAAAASRTSAAVPPVPTKPPPMPAPPVSTAQAVVTSSAAAAAPAIRMPGLPLSKTPPISKPAPAAVVPPPHSTPGKPSTSNGGTAAAVPAALSSLPRPPISSLQKPAATVAAAAAAAPPPPVSNQLPGASLPASAALPLPPVSPASGLLPKPAPVLHPIKPAAAAAVGPTAPVARPPVPQENRQPVATLPLPTAPSSLLRPSSASLPLVSSLLPKPMPVRPLSAAAAMVNAPVFDEEEEMALVAAAAAAVGASRHVGRLLLLFASMPFASLSIFSVEQFHSCVRCPLCSRQLRHQSSVPSALSLMQPSALLPKRPAPLALPSQIANVSQQPRTAPPKAVVAASEGLPYLAFSLRLCS